MAARGFGPWHRELLAFAEFVAICGLAVAQPMFNVAGKHAEIFSTRRTSPVELVAFTVVVLLLPPLVLLVIELVAALVAPRSQPIATNERIYWHVADGVIAAGLVAPAVIGAWSGGVIRRLLASRVMRGLGVVSYGIYLWHTAIIRGVLDALGGRRSPLGVIVWTGWHPPFLVFCAIALSATTMVAAASYFGVERRVVMWAHARTRRHAAWP